MRLAPPAPFVPQVWHGKPIAGIQVCHSGTNADADLAAVRALEDPIVDLISPKPCGHVVDAECHGAQVAAPLLEAEFLPGLSSEFWTPSGPSALRVTSPLSQVGQYLPPGRRPQRPRGRRRGGRQPRRPLHRWVQRHPGRGASPTRMWPGPRMDGGGSGPTRPAGTTSTSSWPRTTAPEPPTPTAPTTSASNAPRPPTTPTTCSA